MRIENNRLKAFIADSGLLKADQITEAESEAKKSGMPFRDVLIKK